MSIKTLQDLVRAFSAGEMARRKGLDPEITFAVLWQTYEIGGEVALLYDPDGRPEVETFREWHMHRMLQEFEMEQKGRHYDPSYIQIKFKHLRKAWEQGSLDALFRTDINLVVAGWDYSANYMRIAKSTLKDLRYWYEHHSSYAVLLK